MGVYNNNARTVYRHGLIGMNIFPQLCCNEELIDLPYTAKPIYSARDKKGAVLFNGLQTFITLAWGKWSITNQPMLATPFSNSNYIQWVFNNFFEILKGNGGPCYSTYLLSIFSSVEWWLIWNPDWRVFLVCFSVKVIRGSVCDIYPLINYGMIRLFICDKRYKLLDAAIGDTMW